MGGSFLAASTTVWIWWMAYSSKDVLFETRYHRLDNLRMNSLQNLASQSLVLYLPWSKAHIAIGSGFNWAAIASGSSPWVSKCPYIIDGGISSYWEGNSSSSAQHSEHFSASLGVTVGCKFLSVSVTGSYDKSVSDNLAVLEDQKAHEWFVLTYDR